MRNHSHFFQVLCVAAALMGSSHAIATQVTEDYLGDAIQELKNYMGLQQGNQREHENLLRAFPPPDHEQSTAAGDAIQGPEAQIRLRNYENALTSNSLFWNILQPAGDVTNSTLVKQHLAGYCSQEEAAAKICEQGLPVALGGAADILASTLLGSPTISETIGYDAAIAFIHNLTNPEPITLPSNLFASADFVLVNTPTNSAFHKAGIYEIGIRELTSDGVSALATRYKQMALLSVAQFALNQIAAERQEVPGLGNNTKLPGGKLNGSIFEALQYEATRRFANPEWHDEMYKLPDTAILREMANMQAVQLDLDFKRYELDQTIAALLSTQIALQAQVIGEGEAAAQLQ